MTSPPLHPSVIRAPVDDAAHGAADRILDAVAYAAQRLLNADDHAPALDDVLARLGRATGVSRVYVFSTTLEGPELVARQRYEWVGAGVVPQIDNPAMLPLPFRAAGFGRWADDLLAGRAIAGDVGTFPPEVDAFLAEQDIRSILLVPVGVDRRLWGFIGFDECSRQRPWTEREIAALTTAAGVLAGSIQQETAREALRASERAYAAAYERERQAADRLRALDGMKDAFLEAVSHELRTPLTSVIGFAETLRRLDVAGDDERGREVVTRLVANVGRLRHVLDDLLDLSQLARGGFLPTPQPTDVPAVVGRVVDRLAPLLRDHVVTTHVAVAVAEVDSTTFDRILGNLLRNAARHTPAGTGVTVRVWAGEGTLELAVEDTGPGIADEHKRRVFEPFERGPDAERHAPGTGVGLSVVARAAFEHSGRAWIEDRPGGGMVVRVTLADGPTGPPCPAPGVPRSG